MSFVVDLKPLKSRVIELEHQYLYTPSFILMTSFKPLSLPSYEARPKVPYSFRQLGSNKRTRSSDSDIEKDAYDNVDVPICS